MQFASGYKTLTRRRRALAVIVMLLLAIFLVPTAGLADWRENVGVFRVGMPSSHPAARDPSLSERVRTSFVALLKMPVQVVPFDTIPAMIDAQASGHIQYALHTAASFAATLALCECVEALAMPRGRQGTIGFRSVLAVDRSRLADLSDLSGATIGYSRKSSVSGWSLPSNAVETGGLDRASFVEKGSVGALLKAFENGEIDGFFGWTAEFETGIANERKLFGRYDAGSVDIVWQSQIVPHGPHAILSLVPEEVRARLVTFLLEANRRNPQFYDAIEPYFGGGFVPTTNDVYRVMSFGTGGLTDRTGTIR